MKNVIVVGNIADNPFAENMVHYLRQDESYSDIISLKTFLNNEFCPRFIIDENNMENVGNKLEGKTVIIVSTSHNGYTRNSLAMRNFLIARAAKDNGAEKVILLEPDLYYSAQDRGPRREHGFTKNPRENNDYKKFDGQPFSARLYADLLKESGVDSVVTVHNHSLSVKTVFMDRLSGSFYNLKPAQVYAGYMKDSDIVDEKNLVFCAPDKGSVSFVKEVHSALGNPDLPILIMSKERSGERDVTITISEDSKEELSVIEGKDVVIVDDMVRTGSTIVECCKYLKKAKPNKIIFFVTHFYASDEGRAKLNDPSIDEIITTDTIPQILNRDVQGRLRRKMVVLRISRWISKHILETMGKDYSFLKNQLYREDMSSKNPRWKGSIGPLFSCGDEEDCP